MSRRGALLLAGVSLCACSGSGQTAIDLAILYDPGLGLDRFALTASSKGESLVDRTPLPEADRPLSESGREAVLLLVADDLGGDEVTLQVDGLAGGDVLASGQESVRIAVGELVAAEVMLRPVGGDGCEEWDWQPESAVSYGGKGGDGGDGHGDEKGSKAMKGMEAGDPGLDPLVGGCPGGRGGGGGGSAGRIHLNALGELSDLGALVTPEAE